MRQARAWLMIAVAATLLCSATARADDAPCTDGTCSKGRFIDHFPYVWYLRMHWGHYEVAEQYGSACYNVTPSYRVFKPYCWYVNPAELYPSGPPPVEPKTIAATATEAPKGPEELPQPRPEEQ